MFKQKENRESEINEAILTGIISIALVILTLKDQLIPLHQYLAIGLTLLYSLVGALRIFGILLPSDSLKNFSLDLFRLIIPTATTFVFMFIGTSILYAYFNPKDLTNIENLTWLSLCASIPAFYSACLVLILTLKKVFGLEIKFRSPIEIGTHKKKQPQKITLPSRQRPSKPSQPSRSHQRKR